MAISEAQKRANKRYNDAKTKMLGLRFSDREYDLLEWIKSQEPSASGYLKELARRDMLARSKDEAD